MGAEIATIKDSLAQSCEIWGLKEREQTTSQGSVQRWEGLTSGSPDSVHVPGALEGSDRYGFCINIHFGLTLSDIDR